MTKIQSIRKEFGEPFRDVVHGFAEMGYSRKMTAGILEINARWFYEICKNYNLNQYFVPYKSRRDLWKPRIYTGGWKRPDVKGVRKYSDADLLGRVRKHPSIYLFAEQAGVSIGTVKGRFKKPWKEIVRKANER
jgi:hypothetical protein